MRRMVQLIVLASLFVEVGVLVGCADQQVELTLVVTAPTDEDRANFPNIPDNAIVIKYNAVSSEDYTLTIHATNGNLVKTLANNQSQQVGDVITNPWDLTDNTNQQVVPGVYVINYSTITMHTVFTLFIH